MSGTPSVRHVAILGLMGSGKTTVGTGLASLLGWPLSDSDVEIEAREGRTVRELRDDLGTDAMHALETRHLLESLAAPGPSVICPAAFVAEDDACLAALGDPSVVLVLLTAEPRVAARRFLTGGHRPWYGEDPATFLAQQAARRYPRIRALGPIEVATDDRPPEVIVRHLADALVARGVAVPHTQSQ